MPIYEYKCSACGHCFEKLMFAGDDAEKMECPKCGDPGAEKMISCASFLGGTKSGLCRSGSSSGFS